MSKPRVLYIVYWGAAEPLGQSLVLPSIKRLANLGVDLTLVTFEKPSDLQRKDLIARIRVELEKNDVRWIPLRYHKRPKVPATGFDFLQGCVRGLVSQLGSRPDIVHSRTFVGGLMGLAISSVLRSKLIYHNEGFYPDEQVDAGVWKANSTPHRVAKSLERKIYSRADAIIAMSHRGKRAIEEVSAVRRKETPVIVVPSCVDLNHFQSQQPKLRTGQDAVRFVYSGSIGGRYKLDQAGRFVVAASSEFGNAHLQVLTPQDRALVASMLRQGGLKDDAWSTEAVPHSAMPAMLADQDAGLLFLTRGLSEHGCSPTKIGEYWAMGLPVVTTPNISDTDEIIRTEKVGVVVGKNSDEAFRNAARELKSLLEDEELPARCRRAAERHYALEPACDHQFKLYEELSSKSVGSTVTIQASELGKP
jgi:glycosyltransferase involved in cell wall biosynthesis